MYTITYSTKRGKNDAQCHYPNLEFSAHEILSASGNFLSVVIKEFQLYLTQTGQKIPSYEECAYELLMLGTLWRIYENEASKSGKSPLNHEKFPLESFIKPVENFLNKAVFKKRNSYANSTSPELNLENLDKLLYRLETSTELKQLQIWREFLNTQEPENVADYLRNILIFADWFKKSSKILIGDSGHQEFLQHLRLMENDICNR